MLLIANMNLITYSTHIILFLFVLRINKKIICWYTPLIFIIDNLYIPYYVNVSQYIYEYLNDIQ